MVFGSRNVLSSANRWTAAAVLVVALAGCDARLEAARSQLGAHADGWRRSLVSLQSQESGLRGRFDSQTTRSFLPGSQSAVIQVRASLDGVHQSLSDVDVQIRQTAARFERQVSEGVAPDDAAERERRRIDGYLATMTEQLSVAQQTLERFEQTVIADRRP